MTTAVPTWRTSGCSPGAVTGTVDGRPIVVGRRSLFSSIEPAVASGADAAEAGTAVSGPGRGHEVAFVVSDRVKATTAQAITLVFTDPNWC